MTAPLGRPSLRSELPGCASVIVTSHGRPGHLKRALAAGVRGFLPKTVSAHVLADVVRVTHSDGRYVDPELAAEAISSAGDSPLTPREADVLELAAGGAPIEETPTPPPSPPAQYANYLSSAASKLGAANPPRSRPRRPHPRLDMTRASPTPSVTAR